MILKNRMNRRFATLRIACDSKNRNIAIIRVACDSENRRNAILQFFRVAGFTKMRFCKFLESQDSKKCESAILKIRKNHKNHGFAILKNRKNQKHYESANLKIRRFALSATFRIA